MVYGGIYFWLFLSLLAEIAADYYLKLWSVKSENIQLAIGIFLYALATLFFAFSMKGGGIMKMMCIYTLLNLVAAVAIGAYFGEKVDTQAQIGIFFAALSVYFLS